MAGKLKLRSGKEKRTRIPWVKIKNAYLYRDPAPSLAALAREYGAGVSTVRRRSGVEHWPDLRREAQAEVERKARAIAEEDRARDFAEWDRRHLKGAETLYASGLAELVVKDPKDDTKTILNPALTAGEKRAIAAVLREVLEIERKVHDREVVKVEDVTRRSFADDLLGNIQQRVGELDEEARLELLEAAKRSGA